jgi:hypothetical protein
MNQFVKDFNVYGKIEEMAVEIADYVEELTEVSDINPEFAKERILELAKEIISQCQKE